MLTISSEDEFLSIVVPRASCDPEPRPWLLLRDDLLRSFPRTFRLLSLFTEIDWYTFAGLSGGDTVRRPYLLARWFGEPPL